MRYTILLFAASAIATAAGSAAAGETLYSVDYAEEQGEGFVPASDSQHHPAPKQFYADDFTLDDGASLTHIAWFGYSDNWNFPDLTNFTVWEIHIYKGQGEMVEPGELIYEAVFDEPETNPQALGPGGLYGSTMYRHEVELAEPLELEAGQQYWLAIGADALDTAGDWWLWAQAPAGDETVATWDWDDQVWEIRGPDWDPEYPTYNVAFELVGEAVVGTPGDLDGDGSVDVSDLLSLLSEWGACESGRECPADLDEDGAVGVNDLLTLLASWG